MKRSLVVGAVLGAMATLLLQIALLIWMVVDAGMPGLPELVVLCFISLFILGGGAGAGAIVGVAVSTLWTRGEKK